MKSTGTGDYTKDRLTWLPKKLSEIKEGLLEEQKRFDASSREPANVAVDPAKITDYTKQRKEWLDKDFDTVMADIKERRKKKITK